MKCGKCKLEKEISAFHKNAKWCKLCKKEYNTTHKTRLKEKRRLDYLKNKERDNQRNNKYYQENKSSRKQYYENNKLRFHEYYVKSSYGSSDKQIATLVNRTEARATKNGLQFDLDFDFVKSLFEQQNGQCLLTGITFDLEKPQITSMRPFSMSLDRIVPELGYTRENVRLICSIVNFAINEFGLDNFDKMCQYYLKRKNKI